MEQKHYILDKDKNIQTVDMLTWVKWKEDFTNNIVKQEEANGVEVSTVFLGVDYRFDGDGAPILFETMVFGGKLDGEEDRYCTYTEAEDGHVRMKARVEKETK